MDESALERFFDRYIENDSSETETEEVVEESSVELRLLPDELLTLYKDDSGSSSSVDHSSQNAAAADELRGASSASSYPIHPSTPVKPEIQRPTATPELQNVLSTAKLVCSLDLDFIARTAWNVEYKPQAYRAVIMRIRKPRATVMIFKTGNIVCTGAKSREDSRVAARKCARILQKLGFPVRFLNFRVQNLVATCFAFPVRLKQLANHQHCSYEPELFPSVVYRGSPGVTALIFASGKIVMTGAKAAAEIHQAFDQICSLLISDTSLRTEWRQIHRAEDRSSASSGRN